MVEIALDDNVVKSPDGSLIDLGVDVIPPRLDAQAAGTRAEKYNYALGGKSPGTDQLYQQIVSGNEDDMRKDVAIQDSLDLQGKKLGMAQELIRSKNGQPLSQGEWDYLQGLNREDVKDPNTIIEKMYAERVMSDSFYTAQSGPIVSARDENAAETYKIMDTGELMIRNTEVIKKKMEDLDIKWGDTSFLGKTWDYVEGFIPFKSWSNLSNEVAGFEGGSFLLGNNMKEQIEYLWTLPPDQFAEKFNQTVEEIAASNQQDARTFAQAAISYGSTDAAWGNLQSGFDLADAFGAAKAVGGAARGLRAGAKAVGAATEAVETGSEALGRVDARTAGTARINDPNGGMGINIREGGPTSPIDGSPAKTTQQINDLSGGVGVNIQKGGPTSPMPGSNVRINNLDGGFGVNIPVVGATENIRDAKVAVQRTVKSLSSRSDVDIPEVLSATGNPNAAPVGAIKSIMVNSGGAGAGSEKAMMQDLLKHMPTYADPQAIAKGSYRFTREQADRIIQRVEEAVNVSKRNVNEAYGLERLSANAVTSAVQQATEQVKREFPHISNSIADISVNEAEKSIANVYSVNFDLKQTSNDLFGSKEQAKFWADNMYKLNDYSIEPQGNGYFLRVTRNIDETNPKVRDALIDTQNETPSSFASRFLGALRGATDKLSQSQTTNRVKMVYRSQKDLSDWKQILGSVTELQGSFSKGEKDRFLRFVQANSVKLRTDPVTGAPMKGDFYRNLGEFENEWYKSFDRWPSEKEAKAYFGYIAAYDHDYVRRNLDIYRYKARQNISKFQLVGQGEAKDGLPAFEGRFVTDSFNRRNLSGQATIGVWDDASGSLTTLRKEHLRDTAYTERIDNMLASGAQVIQIADPYGRPLQAGTGSGEIVNFVITKNFKNAKLDFEQIPYRPGGHIAYDMREGIKQPKMAQLGSRNAYLGDTTVRMTNTPKEAKALVAGYEKARLLLKDNDFAGFKAFVAKNLPDDPDKLLADFRSGTLNVDSPFVHTTDAARSIDNMSVRNSLGGFEDPNKDPYNLMKGLSTDFAGERGLGEVPSVHNIGTDNNPVYGFQPAKYIDPLDTINRAGAQLAKSKYLDDYRISSAEQFIEQFKDLLNVSEDAARSNPVAVLMDKNALNKNFADKDKLAAARNMQSSVQQLLGTRTQTNEWIERSKKIMYDSVYSKAGETSAELLDNHVLSRISDPSVFLRRSAFMLQLGLFNPLQFMKQAQGFLHSVAVAGPIHGTKGASVYPFMRALMASSGSDDMISGIAKKASAFGWKADDFAEMYKAMRQSGLTDIGASHSWKDDLLEPKMFSGKVGQMLDKSTFFFNEGERLNRMVSFATSYSEWRAANKFTTFDRRAMDQVLRRTDVLNVNMTKAGDAAWQQGVLNVPAQFYSYQLRLWEQFLGKQLTGGEKARAIMTYSAMYGIPVGVGNTLLPVRDWYDDIRGEALKRGLPDNPLYIDAMSKGIAGVVSELVTGRETNANTAYGPGSVNFLSDAFDGEHTFLQVALGASGSTMGNIYKTSIPVLRSIQNVFGESSSENFEILGADVLDLMKNAKSVNLAYNAWYGLNFAKMVNKNQVKVDDINTAEVIMGTILGISPKSGDDIWNMQTQLRNVKEAKQEAANRAGKYFNESLQATIRGDDDKALALNKYAAMWLDLAGMDPVEKRQAAQQAYRGHEDLWSRTNRRYMEKIGNQGE